MRRFIQQFTEDGYRSLKRSAKKRGITVQEMVRVMVADYLEANRK